MLWYLLHLTLQHLAEASCAGRLFYAMTNSMVCC